MEYLPNLTYVHYIYFAVFIAPSGMNSIFNLIPRPCASRFTIPREGFLVPFSMRLISACVIPVLSDNSFCVNPSLFRASIIAWIISYSGWRASYSAFTSGFSSAFRLVCQNRSLSYKEKIENPRNVRTLSGAVSVAWSPPPLKGNVPTGRLTSSFYKRLRSRPSIKFLPSGTFS